MKKEIIDIPEVQLSDVKEFWVLGSQYKDGILGEYNLKMDIKKAILGGDSADTFDLDISSYTYPQEGSGLFISAEDSLPMATRLYEKGYGVGDTVKILEPDGNIHDYTLTSVYYGGAGPDYGEILVMESTEYWLNIEYGTSNGSSWLAIADKPY